MKAIALLLVLVAGCRTVVVRDTGAAAAGATSPAAAVQRFVAAARTQDIQALGAVWGDEHGAMRDRTDRKQMEERSIIMLSCLRHDKAVLSAPMRGVEGRELITVDFTQGALTGTSQFTLAKGPGGRWFVLSFDIVALQNKGFCSKPAD